MTGLRVRLVGPTNHETAFSRVNARWAAGLEARGHIVQVGAEDPCDVALVNDWTRPFGAPDLPPDLPRVAVRPWDFGPFPARWASVVADHYDELWVHSSWSRELAVRGGVPPDRLRVVPLGVDLDVFGPDGAAHPLTDDAATTFLFVGATVRRKGIDVLVDAYLSAFAATDDVQLVVKDHTGDVFYGGQDHGERLKRVAASGGPTIRYADDLLAPADLAALYRGADALVLPYRAEGFALAPLEAMACGTAPVLPRFGAVLDYADEATAWFTPARRISLPVGRTMAYNSLGLSEEVAEVDFCEPRPEGLADLLARVAAQPSNQRIRRGRAAAKSARRWSWDASADRVVEGLGQVVARRR